MAKPGVKLKAINHYRRMIAWVKNAEAVLQYIRDKG